MPTKRQTITLYAQLLVLLLCALRYNISHALTAEEAYASYYENWYQVEMIIFERIEQGGEDPERWPINLSLTYPPRLTFLTDPSFENEDNASGDDAVDENNRDTGEADSELLATLQRASVEDPLNKKYRDAVEKAERDRLTPDEQPYVLLGEAERALNHEARILGRDRSMRVLFHESWRQPMTDREQAPAIVLTGGEAYDVHYELEGSVTFFVSRYLHLHTDIWLSQFEANVGQELEHWPPLPERPTPPEPEEENPSTVDAAQLSPDDVLSNELSFDMRTGTNDTLNTLEYGNDNTTLFGSNDHSLWSDYANISEQAYVTKNIVKLAQQRRMRSSEIHYLDHPKLGIIVVIEKYQPEPAAIEDAEAAANAVE